MSATINGTPNGTTPTQNFNYFLQSELLRRCRANPKYSLRAFARSLDIEASALSKVLNGKRRVTTKMFHKLSGRLALNSKEVHQFAPEARLPRLKKVTKASVIATPAYSQISSEVFESISDWYHFAILELIGTAGFKSDAKWIASRLNITQSEAKIAVQRLKQAGFIRVQKNGKWEDASGDVSVSQDGVTSAALRRLQKQVLEKSMDALENIDISERDHSSMCMAVNSAQLAKARTMIRKFRRELCEVLKNEGGPRDSVFNLHIGLHPVTQIVRGKK
jgi:uncharacterized protein (TIGR02147 family)